MAKTTINIDKIEQVDTDLLERGITHIALELASRCHKVRERRLDVEDDEVAEIYKQRYEAFRQISQILENMPGRIEYAE